MDESKLTDEERLAQLREVANPVGEGEYWTAGLAGGVPNDVPLVHRDLQGKLNIRVCEVPGEEESQVCWVEIVEGDLFNGVGKLLLNWLEELAVDDEQVEANDLIYYRGGSQDDMPQYAGVHKKALDW